MLARGTVFLFGPGSLYTSIVPSLLLPGVGEAIAAAGARGARRLLLLNAGAYPRVPVTQPPPVMSVNATTS
ncbi:MAG: 2-phospho-L-lactate transferase CofD family protein [Promethearchaeia archaeon]